MNKELIDRIIQFSEKCETLEGTHLEIQEIVAATRMNLDLPDSQLRKYELVLEKYMIRLSGAIMVFMGDQFAYEIDTTRLEEFRAEDNSVFTCIEQVKSTGWRKSVLTFKTETHV